MGKRIMLTHPGRFRRILSQEMLSIPIMTDLWQNGSQMGPFYELETSSPAADLNPGKSSVIYNILCI